MLKIKKIVLLLILFKEIQNICEQTRNKCELSDDQVISISQGIPQNGIQISNTDQCMTNQAYYFDGTDQYLQFPDNTIGNNLTIQFQVKWIAFKQYSRVIDFGIDNGTNNFQILNGNSDSRFFAQTYSDNDFNQIASDNLTLNQWFHIIVEFSSNSIKMYIDNTLQTSVVGGDSIHSDGVRKELRTKNYIGKSNWPYDQYFKGFIDELIIYEYIATQEQRNCMFDVCEVTYCILCKGSSQICQQCEENRIGNTCDCPDNYYDENSVAQCSQCPFEGCKTCSGNINCDSCYGSIGQDSSRIMNNCECPQKYFSDLANDIQECQPCLLESCLTCNNLICLSCIGSQNLESSRINDDCSCPSKYYSDLTNNTEECQKCTFEGCDTCTSSQCISCLGSINQTSSRINNDCICPQGYFSNISNDTNSVECLICDNKCHLCDQNSYNCTQCRGNRINESTCECPSNYFDEDLENCTQCPFQACKQCNNLQCTLCLGTLQETFSRVGNDCHCPSHFISILAQQEDCVECEFKCQECENQIDNCASCTGNRVLENNCACPAHSYDDGSSINCIECHISCISCDADNCLVCEGNRIINTNSIPEQQECICQVGAIDHFSTINTYYCTNCTEAVITPKFSTDYEQIIIEFYVSIQIPDFFSVEEVTLDIEDGSYEICQFILEIETIQKLGDNCKCRQQTDKKIQIFLGNKPSILNDIDKIQFKTNKIQNQSCENDQYFTNFYENTVQISENSLPPTVQLQIPTSKVTLCQEVQIQMLKMVNDGKRGLFNFQWSIFSTNATNTTLIQQFLDLQNLNNEYDTFMNIPSLTLEPYKKYEFQLSCSNFVNKVGITQFIIETLSTKGTYAKIQQNQPFVFNNWKQNEFIADINSLDCQSGTNTYINQALLIDWIDITTDFNNQETLISYESQPKDKTTEFIIKKYSQPPGIYKIMLKVNIEQEPLMESTHYVEYQIKESPLTAFIQGGNRLQAYASELNLQGEAKDPDLEIDQQQNNLSYSWDCINILDSQDCKNIGGELIELGTEQQISYQKKFFEPYNSFKFIFQAQNTHKQNEDSVIIIVVETDLPLLTVNIPETIRNQKINRNDNLQMVIDSDQDPDEAYYSLIIIYNYEVVATKSYFYNNFSFQIWDLFSDFITSEPQFILRISVYNPQYFMPSQASFTPTINFEPIPGEITVEPSQGIALDTLFFISCKNFYDEDQPLTYKYSFYTQIDHYQQEIKQGGKQIQVYKNLIQDFTNQNQISTILPSGFEDNVLILVSVSDSLGAIKNVTQSVNIIKYSTDYQENLNKFKEIYQKSLDLEQTIKLTQINIMVQEIQQIFLKEDGISYYENLIDTNQLLYQDYLQFKKQVYDYLLTFIGILGSKVIEDQVMKSINILQNIGGNLANLQNNLEISQQIKQIDDLIDEQSQILQDMVQEQLLNQGDNKVTRKQNNINEILGKSFQFMDKMSANIKNSEQNSEQENQIVESTKKLKNAIQQSLLPNEDQILYKGDNISQEIQILTPKQLQNKYFNTKQSGLDIFENDQQNLNQLDTEKGKIYKSSGTGFLNNPFINDIGFPYQNQNTNVQDIDITIQSDNIDFKIQNQQVTMSFPKSPSTNNSENNTCIQRQESDQTWVSSTCVTQEIDNDERIFCQCKDLSPATVIDDLQNIFNDSNASLVFSDQGFSSLGDLNYFETIIFYVYLFKIFGISICIHYGKKKDIQQQNLIKKNQVQNQEQQQQTILSNQEDVKNQIIIPNLKEEDQLNIFKIPTNENYKIDIQNQSQIQTNSNKNTKKPRKKKLKSKKQKEQILKDINQNIDNSDDQNNQIQNKFNLSQEKQKSDSFSEKLSQNQENTDEEIFTNNKQNQNILIQNNYYINQQQNIDIQVKNKDDKQLYLKDNEKNSERQLNFEKNSQQLSQPEYNQKINTMEHSEPQKKQNNEEQIPKIIIKKSPAESLFGCHEFFGIYLIYNKQLSRSSRYIIYFIRINLLLAITALFSQEMSQLQSLIFSVIASIMLAIPILLLKLLLKQKSKIISIIGIIFSIVVCGIAIYTVLVTSAIMGIQKSNEWQISYLSAFCIDNFIFQIISGYLKVFIIKQSILKQNQYNSNKNFIQKILADEGVINYLTDSYN